MPQTIVILGRGKLATALGRIFSDSFDVLKLSRVDFDARHPEGVRAYFEACRPLYVFNTVVSGGLDACATDPAGALAINTLFPLYLAGLSGPLHFTLVHFSTDAVFADTQGCGPRVESSPALPQNMYGYTKFGADSLIPMRTAQYIIYRLPLLFGPAPNQTQFLERMLDRLATDSSLRIATDIFSHAVYSLDVARTIHAHLRQKPKSGLYHLGGAERASLYDLTYYAAKILGYSNTITPASAADFPGVDYKNRSIHLASEKMPPLRSWRESLHDYCKHDIQASGINTTPPP